MVMIIVCVCVSSQVKSSQVQPTTVLDSNSNNNSPTEEATCMHSNNSRAGARNHAKPAAAASDDDRWPAVLICSPSSSSQSVARDHSTSERISPVGSFLCVRERARKGRAVVASHVNRPLASMSASQPAPTLYQLELELDDHEQQPTTMLINFRSALVWFARGK